MRARPSLPCSSVSLRAGSRRGVPRGSLSARRSVPNELIRMRNVEKSYPQGGGRVYVLRRIDVDVAEGDFVSIMGPSGAGKSTLLHILGMHDGEFSGEYELLGRPVHKL